MIKFRRLKVAAAFKPPKDSWEEHLYFSVGKELWDSLTDSNNKCIYLYPNVARWNDSAAKEAFDNAKTRFLAKIKKGSCDVPAPDPEAFIDEIDWSDDAIPELVEESSEWSSEGGFGVEGFEVIDPSFCVGWGPDEWYEPKKEEEEKRDEVRKEWVAYREAKVAKAVGGGGGWGKSGGRKPSSRSCTPRNGGGYPMGQRWMF